LYNSNFYFFHNKKFNFLCNPKVSFDYTVQEFFL